MLFILAVAKIIALIPLGVFTRRSYSSLQIQSYSVVCLHCIQPLSSQLHLSSAAQENHFGKDFSAGTRVPDGSLCGS